MTDRHDHPPHLPPPWNPTGEAYFILCSRTVENLRLSSGTYNRLEAGSDFADEEKSGKFKGSGLGGGIVQIIRYHTSPVGPYDELVYLPGQFETPGGNTHWRVTNIYVSSEASVYNGRRNWNIPKHLANFSFTPIVERGQNTRSVHVKVSQPHSDGSKPNPPFFSAICTPYRYIPSFPLNTDYIPFNDFTATHPPLPGSPDAYCEISTDQWRTVKMTMKGRASITSIQPAARDAGEDIEHGELADGTNFPKIKPFAAVYFKRMELIFPEPTNEVVVSGRKKKDD